ncbi:effector-associated constant component EACC1 [Streptomyces sp. BE133]|uniref:effector-associated constant component EACC1 n=1 Tax=Streptomyces sp. BE133 TaxID=3002523 RepID=UPI002E7717C2|nr:hypothetical protein [Streptomyces sp. BE133]MEE1809687.1 hypothetical protein [Streptomyces sp. BE133]
MTEITLAVTKEDGKRVDDGLRMFVNRDRSMRGTGRADWEPKEIRDGELGTTLDILAIIVSGVLGIPGAIDVVSRWCRSQGSSQTVRIVVGSRSVTVEGTEDPAEIARLAETLKAAVPPPAP